MNEPSMEQIRAFRLRGHHLDRIYPAETVLEAVGACGMQNTPPGAWENALYQRVPSCSLSRMEELLSGKRHAAEKPFPDKKPHPAGMLTEDAVSRPDRTLQPDRTLLQAWSLRGAPFVFPASESPVFLSALIPQAEAPWIYTRGITLALDFLGMEMEPFFELLKQVIVRLDDAVIVGKNSLDQTLAGWMEPFLPEEKRQLWNRPSMYGEPDRQTVGGAVVSFLLRPCALEGLVVFGKRGPQEPSFTSLRGWMGHSLPPDAQAQKQAQKRLVRKYLHCYGPATPAMLADWLGCSGKQARRLWAAVSEEMEEVQVCGKKAWILSADHESLFSSPDFPRPFVLPAGYDPYLDQRDRQMICPEKELQRKIWRTVANPGVVLFQGRAVGIWSSRKKKDGLSVAVTLWQYEAGTGFPDEASAKRTLCEMAEAWAAFRGLSVRELKWESGK